METSVLFLVEQNYMPYIFVVVFFPCIGIRIKRELGKTIILNIWPSTEKTRESPLNLLSASQDDTTIKSFLLSVILKTRKGAKCSKISHKIETPGEML